MIENRAHIVVVDDEERPRPAGTSIEAAVRSYGIAFRVVLHVTRDGQVG